MPKSLSSNFARNKLVLVASRHIKDGLAEIERLQCPGVDQEKAATTAHLLSMRRQINACMGRRDPVGIQLRPCTVSEVEAMAAEYTNLTIALVTALKCLAVNH